MSAQSSSYSLIDADIGGRRTTLRVCGERIESIGDRPLPAEHCIDMQGDRVLPGLINAHDHLQWNSFAAPLPRTRYANASEWIAELGDSSGLAAAYEARTPRSERLLGGGVKNLLSGVTTVAHHDPLYPELRSAAFPIRVVERYGWAHSLSVDGERQVADSYRATPFDQPWIVHAAEGTDAAAADEFARLAKLGCVGANSLLVHCVGMKAGDFERLASAGAGLIWCPASNLNLFGKTLEDDALMATKTILGSDSRLTGSRDLLDELRVARTMSRLDGEALESMATLRSAQCLRLSDRGELRAGALADFLVLPRAARLGEVSRSDVRLVAVGGSARYGDAHYTRQMNEQQWTPICVDGVAKMLVSSLATQAFISSLREPGLEFHRTAWRAA